MGNWIKRRCKYWDWKVQKEDKGSDGSLEMGIKGDGAKKGG